MATMHAILCVATIIYSSNSLFDHAPGLADLVELVIVASVRKTANKNLLGPRVTRMLKKSGKKLDLRDSDSENNDDGEEEDDEESNDDEKDDDNDGESGNNTGDKQATAVGSHGVRPGSARASKTAARVKIFEQMAPVDDAEMESISKRLQKDVRVRDEEENVSTTV